MAMALLAGARVATPDGIVDDGWLDVSNGKIAAIGSGSPPRPADEELDESWIVPGFVDMHSHGGGGSSVVGAASDDVRTFVETHLKHGTTSIVASLVSGFYEELEKDVRNLAELADAGLIVGIHLEGPWISPHRKGAHNAEALTTPEPADVLRLLEAGQDHVRMVTIAPELEFGLDAVRAVVDGGAVAAVGHTDATYDQALQAVDAGATVATHLFNAMAPIHHRNPGPIIALLEDERISVELICDGVHLHPAIAGHAYRAAGTDRTVLVTDAMAAAGYADGSYPLGDLEVQVVDGVARLVEGGSIAGSTLTMDRAFRFAVQDAGFSVTDAVAASSTNPAKLLGIADRTGAITEGLAADLVVLDDGFNLQRVMRAGTWVG